MEDRQEFLSKERLVDVLKKHDMSTYIRLRAAETIELMTKKNAQYGDGINGTHDNLANFRAGANLVYGYADYRTMFEESKNYCRKHIAHVYGPNQGIDTDKLKESLGDIIVYSLIQMYMIDQYQYGQQSAEDAKDEYK